MAEKQKTTWELLKNIQALGYDRNRVFNDWLELVLNCLLSSTENYIQGYESYFNRLRNNAFQGEYEKRYLRIMEAYDNNKEIGRRPADYFSMAWGAMICESIRTGEDPLGDLFMKEITFSDNGQFFSPWPVCLLMAELTGVQTDKTISDPACGSGRMLLAAARERRFKKLIGIDVDYRCAVMAVLNMAIHDYNAVIVWGDCLKMTWSKEWEIRPGGLVFEKVNQHKDQPHPLLSKK